MQANTLFTADATEFLIAQRKGNFAEVCAFAAFQAAVVELREEYSEASAPTIPAPPPSSAYRL